MHLHAKSIIYGTFYCHNSKFMLKCVKKYHIIHFFIHFYCYSSNLHSRRDSNPLFYMGDSQVLHQEAYESILPAVFFHIYRDSSWHSKLCCRSRGIRTPSPPWQGGILTIILRPRNFSLSRCQHELSHAVNWSFLRGYNVPIENSHLRSQRGSNPPVRFLCSGVTTRQPHQAAPETKFPACQRTLQLLKTKNPTNFHQSGFFIIRKEL